MRTLRDWLVTMLTLSLALIAMTQVGSDPALLLASGLAVVVLTAAIGSRYLAVLITSRVIRVGHRARAHRHVLAVVPAPRHPNTPGRRRSRAPSLSVAVT